MLVGPLLVGNYLEPPWTQEAAQATTSVLQIILATSIMLLHHSARKRRRVPPPLYRPQKFNLHPPRRPGLGANSLYLSAQLLSSLLLTRSLHSMPYHLRQVSVLRYVKKQEVMTPSIGPAGPTGLMESASSIAGQLSMPSLRHSGQPSHVSRFTQPINEATDFYQGLPENQPVGVHGVPVPIAAAAGPAAEPLQPARNVSDHDCIFVIYYLGYHRPMWSNWQPSQKIIEPSHMRTTLSPTMLRLLSSSALAAAGLALQCGGVTAALDIRTTALPACGTLTWRIRSILSATGLGPSTVGHASEMREYLSSYAL